MFDHVGLRTLDLTASTAFYRATFKPLGHDIVYQDDATVGIGPKGAAALWLHQAAGLPGLGVHVAFKAASRDEVEAAHAAGLLAGGCDNGPPGLRPDYGDGYFAAFVVDPDGNNVEIVTIE